MNSGELNKKKIELPNVELVEPIMRSHHNQEIGLIQQGNEANSSEVVEALEPWLWKPQTKYGDWFYWGIIKHVLQIMKGAC